MLRQALASAIIAGAVAGVLLSGLQAIQVIPLILEAKTHETSGETTGTVATAHHHDVPASGHRHEDGIAVTRVWAPEEG